MQNVTDLFLTPPELPLYLEMIQANFQSEFAAAAEGARRTRRQGSV